MSQLLVYLPAARTSQVTRVHAQQSLLCLRTGRPVARGGERGRSRGPVSGPRSGGRASEPAQPAGPARPPLPASQVRVVDGMVGEVLSMGDREVGQGPEAQENEGAGSGSTLAGQQLLRGSDRDPVRPAHAQPIGSRFLRVLGPENRN